MMKNTPEIELFKVQMEFVTIHDKVGNAAGNHVGRKPATKTKKRCRNS